MSDSIAASSSPAPVAPARGHLIAAVFVGGAFGTLLRAALLTWVPHDAGGWPVATLVVNLVGAFAIGVISVWLPRAPDLDPRLQPFLATGFCGGLTTFATLQVELVLLVDHGAWGVAAGYLAVTLVGGIVAVLAGRAVAAGEEGARRS
ncbi:MAG: CrcB family protein [Solirubrobacteraceae bacterium]|nr:CrcB family protein [Solirubrobacteraceae bacterium]